MPGSPNKLSQFWQELKRRKVVHVITVYAASAFVILELINNVSEPLRLPDWTPTMVLVILAIGFPLAVIFSWIFDATPEGIEKTKPLKEISKENKSSTPSSWKIASYISFVVIVALIVLNIIPRSGKKDVLDKSIAVLPFRNDSPEETEMFFINGTMEAILDNLCKISDLRVVARTSVEQYRNNPKPVQMIAEEMNVSYILEGSGHRDGNQVRLFIQLVDGKKDQHIWSKTYDADIQEIFSMESEIEQSVAAEIEAIITPEEKQRIEKKPTRNLTAYDFYQRGKDEYWNSNYNTDRRASLERAEHFYHRALEYDSTFALAYTGLARVYMSSRPSAAYFSENYLDSVLILADKALSYDNQLSEAYSLRGDYYRERIHSEKAIKEYDKAIDLNPSDWMAYWGRALLYYDVDGVKSLDNLYKCASLYQEGTYLPSIFMLTHYQYALCGFYQKSNYYLREKLKLDDDSAFYYWQLANNESFRGGDLTMQLDNCMKAYRLDPDDLNYIYGVASLYLGKGQYAESLRYFKIWLERLTELDELGINNMHRLGYAYWVNGYKKEAMYYINMQKEYCIESIKLGRVYEGQLDLAMIYAFMGEKEKANENLRIFNQDERMPSWAVTIMKSDPFFDSLRDEPEFQQIAGDVEAKFQAEHERVRQWLEENDIL